MSDVNVDLIDLFKRSAKNMSDSDLAAELQRFHAVRDVYLTELFSRGYKVDVSISSDGSRVSLVYTSKIQKIWKPEIVKEVILYPAPE